MIAIWFSFVLIGLPLCVCCVHEACHESLSIYNFSSKSTASKTSSAGAPGGKNQQNQTPQDSGLINDVRYILKLPLMWSFELVVLYTLLLLLKPSWVSIPLQIYFIMVGSQTLYSYLKAKLAHYSSRTASKQSNETAFETVRFFAILITFVVALCYTVHLVNGDNAAQNAAGKSFFWQK